MRMLCSTSRWSTILLIMISKHPHQAVKEHGPALNPRKYIHICIYTPSMSHGMTAFLNCMQYHHYQWWHIGIVSFNIIDLSLFNDVSAL